MPETPDSAAVRAETRIVARFTGSATMRATASNFVRPPDDHPIYSLIGQVASDWSHLEHELDRIIWTLVASGTLADNCVTAQLMGATPRYKAIVALLTMRSEKHRGFEPLIQKFDLLMKKTFEHQDRRNRIIHDAWFVDTTTKDVGQYKSRTPKHSKIGISKSDETEIKTLLAKINELVSAVKKYYRACVDELKASQQTQP